MSSTDLRREQRQAVARASRRSSPALHPEVGWDALVSRLRMTVGPYDGERSPAYELTPEIAGKEFPLNKADLALCQPLGQEE